MKGSQSRTWIRAVYLHRSFSTKSASKNLAMKAQSLYTSLKLVKKVNAAVTTVIPCSFLLFLILDVSFSLMFLDMIMCLSSSYFSGNQMWRKNPWLRDMLFRSASFCTRMGSIFSPFQSCMLKAKASPRSNFTFGPYIVTRGKFSSLFGC